MSLTFLKGISFLLLSSLFLVSSCAGRVAVKKKVDFIPGRKDIHIRSVINHSSSYQMNFIASDALKEYFTYEYKLPLNNDEKFSSLIADIEIVDYKIIPLNSENSSDSYIFWTKIKVTLLGPMSKVVFIDRMDYAIGFTFSPLRSEKKDYITIGNQKLFDKVGQSIIDIVRYGKPRIEFDYSYLIL